MISINLIKEVLKLKQDIKSFEVEYNDIVLKLGEYVDEEHCYDEYTINIYELAHECKLWAVQKEYDFTINSDKIEIFYQGSKIHSLSNMCQHSNFIPFDPFYDIKACQWILDNI